MRFSRWGNLLIMRSVSVEVPSTFMLYESNLRSVIRRHPQGAGIVLLVEHNDPPPEGYADRIQDLLARYREQLLAICAILTARGFAGAVQRGVGTAILTVSRMQGRLSIHQSIEEAVPWLAKRLLPEENRAERSRELRALLANEPEAAQLRRA